jgi:hypothetical protein
LGHDQEKQQATVETVLVLTANKSLLFENVLGLVYVTIQQSTPDCMNFGHPLIRFSVPSYVPNQGRVRVWQPSTYQNVTTTSLYKAIQPIKALRIDRNQQTRHLYSFLLSCDSIEICAVPDIGVTVDRRQLEIPRKRPIVNCGCSFSETPHCTVPAVYEIRMRLVDPLPTSLHIPGTSPKKQEEKEPERDEGTIVDDRAS